MSLEWNKVFAAVLVAGITAKLAGFAANQFVHAEPLKENAYKIEVADAGSTASATKKKSIEPILAMLAEADIENGKKLAKACMACHSFDKGGSNGLGPNLWGVVGSKQASKAGFSYSDSLHGIGQNWSYAELNKFLYKPKEYAPGTKMNYIGIKKAEKRADLIAWLRTMSDAPKALPSAAEIAADVPSE